MDRILAYRVFSNNYSLHAVQLPTFFASYFVAALQYPKTLAIACTISNDPRVLRSLHDRTIINLAGSYQATPLKL